MPGAFAFKAAARRLRLPCFMSTIRYCTQHESSSRPALRPSDRGTHKADGWNPALFSLKDLIAVQLADRRSAVVKQACHLLTVLAGAMGGGFEQFADYILPHLFPVVKITVKVRTVHRPHQSNYR